jgi:hypothetical protein
LGHFRPFRYCTKVDAKLAELSSLTQKFPLKVALEFFAMNAPDPLHWTLNSCSRAFRTVSLLHESRCKTGRTGATNAQVRLTKLRRNFSQRTHLVHSIWSKTHILGCFGLFRYCMKFDAKLDELTPFTPKFAWWSCVAFFHYERTRSTPLDPKLMFLGVSGRVVTVRKSM